MKPTKLIALDIGQARIGVAAADSATKLAYPLTTLVADEHQYQRVSEIVAQEHADIIIIGYPRNQQGETTSQTEYVEQWARQFDTLLPKLFQDESLTSVHAETHLRETKKTFTKEDVDAYAAAIILTDYMEAHYA